MQAARQTPAPEPSRPLAEDSATDGSVLYTERLTPSAGVWAVTALVSSLMTLVFAPIDLWVGLVAALVSFAVVAILLVANTPRIVVTQDTLQVGRAQIERRHLGEVTGHRGEDARMERGPRLHGLAYVTVRGWIPSVVRVQLTDERDRTPYWLTSTRHPEELVAALGGRMVAEAA